jgi:glycosyltransferase involved in cell wall biosynthesis
MNTTTPAHVLPLVARTELPRISCVIPAYNECANLSTLIRDLYQTLAPCCAGVDILVVDDGSVDGTSAVAIALAREYPVRLIQLSRNFGKESAITAGLDHVSGEVVILLDADGQHPVTMLPEFIRRWQQGYDMVYGVRTARRDQPAWKRWLSGAYSRMLNRMSSLDIEPNAGDFRLFDRRVLEALKSLPERTRYMKGLYAWVGFPSIGIPFEPDVRISGKSQFSFRQLSSLAVTGIISFSDIPLRICGAAGALISLCAILYGCYIVISTLMFGVDTPGWATLTVGITFLGGLQLVSMGVLGEYIGRIFIEVKNRPNYVVARRHGFDEAAHDIRPDYDLAWAAFRSGRWAGDTGARVVRAGPRI